MFEIMYNGWTEHQWANAFDAVPGRVDDSWLELQDKFKNNDIEPSDEPHRNSPMIANSIEWAKRAYDLRDK